MAKNTTFSYKGAEDYVIENGVLKGTSEPFAPKYNNYGQVILDRLRANPNFIGQIDADTGRRETLGEMMEKSIKCALWMKKKNIQPGDVVGVCTHNQMDMYVPILASLCVGAVFNAWWDDGIGEEVAKHFLTLTKPKIVFIHGTTLPVALRVVRQTGMDVTFVTFGKQSQDFDSLEEAVTSVDDRAVEKFHCCKTTSLDDPAFIVYTSGTTGLPKGIVTTHKGIFGNSPNFFKLGKPDERVVSMNFSSISWGVGIACLLRGVVVPETRIVHPRFDPELVLRQIAKFKINLIHLSPRKAFKLLKSSTLSDDDLSSLKLFWISGGVLRPEMQNSIAARFPGANVYQAYGSSELGGVAFRQTCGFKASSCGTITRNIMAKIIDPATRRILGPNEPGELCFKSPFMMTNYLDNPEATRRSIDFEGWLHSGDLAYYDEEGHVFVIDRISEMILYRGRYVSPEMIEQTLQTHPDVFDVAVVSVADDRDGQRPVAFVTKTDDSPVTEEEFEKIMHDALPDGEKLRGTVKFIEAVPRLLSGKIARADLKKLALAGVR